MLLQVISFKNKKKLLCTIGQRLPETHIRYKEIHLHPIININEKILNYFLITY